MKNLRKYGLAPFTVAVIHGGPGAAGEMAPVARRLVAARGILEPLQTAASLTGQVAELKAILEKSGDLPVTLIGFSWGAWLSYILAARYPTLVKKLILISSGPFTEIYAAKILETRLSRLDEQERTEVEALLKTLADPAGRDKNQFFARIGGIFSKADSYDQMTDTSELVTPRVDIFERVWPEAAALRKSGQLLALGKQIVCPVIAIHGDHDSHPAKGVQESLSVIVPNFKFILLKHCGHKPWLEKEAQDKFFTILKKELAA